MSNIYSMNTANKLIGCLLQDPQLSISNNYKLEKEEFNSCELHKICYVVIYNLAVNGYNSITIMDFDQYLQNYEAQYNVFNDNNGLEYLQTICDLTDLDNFDAYYNEFKKLSCVREYNNNGFDVKNFWDFEKSDEKNLENINNYSIEEIINYFESIQVGINKRFYPRDADMEEIQAGYGFTEFIERMKGTPMYGFSMVSEYLNTITRGQIKKQLTCCSSASGVGKTTIAIGNMINVCATHIWDYNEKQFIENLNRTSNGGLYIEFEMDLIEELTPKFISCISGIPSNVILDGKFTEEEEERIRIATEILQESNIHLVFMPNFTMKLIEDTIKEHKLKYGIDMIVYDYIAEGSTLFTEMCQASSIGLRTDQVLSNLSLFLKNMAIKYDCAIWTMTQTNANIGQNDILDEGVISGSRGVANKLDIGMVYMPLRPKEKKALEIIEQELKLRGIGIKSATHIFHIYKSRFSSFPKHVKVWVNVDMGTSRITDCFVTDWQNKLIKCNKTALINM